MHIGAFDIVEPLPELKDPHVRAMLRPWIDVGGVGHMVLERVERHLNAKDLGKLVRPSNFYDLTRYRPIVSMVEGERHITVPNTFIRYAQPESGPDFIFLHMLEPHLFGEDYAESVVKLLETFHVKRYVSVGGMYDAVPHTRPLQVSGAIPGGDDVAKRLNVRVRRSNYQGPTSITFIVTQEAAKRGVESMSLMVHLPQYAQLEEDFAGVARLLEILCNFYGLPQALVEAEKGEQQYRQITSFVSRNPQVRALVQQLEAVYDKRMTEQQEEQTTKLAPEVEDFLREMGQRFKDGDGQG